MIRVLVADDSATVRELLTAILEEDPEIRVVGTARDGAEAVRLTRDLKPDVITMDIHMPGFDGFEATREIMIEAPTPIVIVSAAVTETDVAHSLDATRAGALMVLPKPGLADDEANRRRRTELVSMVKAMADVKVVRRRGHAKPRPSEGRRASPSAIRLVAIAASTGGPAVLQRILSDLPRDFPVPVVVVQHIAADFIDGLCRWLNTSSSLRVKVATDGDQLAARTVYLAPDERHLTLEGDRILLSSAPPLDGFRPSASMLFRSAAQSHGGGTVAVMLTGMGRDGVDGLRAVRTAGGRIVAQDEATSVVFGMPGQTVREGLADFVLPAQEIGARLVALVQEGTR